MATFYITHHKFPSNPQLFTITLNKVAGLGGEENPNFEPSYPSAERYWKIFIYTSGLTSEGESLDPIVADLLGGIDTVNEFVETKIAELCALVDWSQQGEYTPQTDSQSPLVVEQFPNIDQTNVPISSPIVIRVKDPLPGNGIDVSTIVMKVDGLTVTPTVVGNKYDYTITYSPRPIYNS